MNKNAAIIEGDTTKKFNPVSKVKVSNSDTGESTWIPEESKTTHSLSVIKNGIYYAASEGYTAYDTVTVNVSSETEVNYEGIIADMPDLADLGLYDLDDLEGLDGLDLDLDELQDLENLILDGDLEEGEIPTSNTKIKGVDPDSGETLEVGLDEDGYLTEEVLPDSIHIVVPPRKRHYMENEIIDFSGIHVYMMNASGHRYTCTQYPTGEIPYSELLFPVTVAEAPEGGSEWIVDGLNSPVYLTQISVGTFLQDSSGVTAYYVSDIQSISPVYIYIQPENVEGVVQYGRVFVSTSHAIVTIKRKAPAGWSEDETEYPLGSRTYGSNTAYISSLEGPARWEMIPLSSEQSIDAWKAAVLTITKGTEKPIGNQDIPVQWMRSDGETLEDTFEITVGEEGEDDQIPDPYAGSYDFTRQGKKYNINRKIHPALNYEFGNDTVVQYDGATVLRSFTFSEALSRGFVIAVG